MAPAEAGDGGTVAQLPPGRHGLPRHFVVDNQRRRILDAVARCCHDLGYAAMSVESITVAAGVSRKTFYELFTNKRAAFLEAYDLIAEQLVAEVAGAVAAQDDPVSRTRAGLDAFLQFLAGEPEFSTMCIVEVLAAGPDAVARRNDVMKAFAAMFEEYTVDLVPPSVSGAITAAAVVGGVLDVVHARILARRTETLPELLPELMYFALAPYVGQDAARAEHDLLLQAARDVERDD